MVGQYNVLIDIVGALLLAAIQFAERGRSLRGDPRTLRLMRLLMLCCTLVFCMDIPGLLLDGARFPGARTLLWLTDGAYWALQALYCWLWTLFADYWAFGSAGRLRRLRLVYSLPMLLELALILTTPFTGWVFTLNAANVYERGSLYVANMLPYILYIFAALAITVVGWLRNRDPEQRRRKLSLVVYMFLPSLGVIFDVFVYGISWVWPMVALSLLMVYLSVQQQYISDEQLAAARMEAELTESRVAVMLSQIQPHFLYNSLNTIEALCAIDAEAAQQATRSFAKYLRGNLDALSRKSSVLFSSELEHVRQYITLEKYRFEGIQMEYDLGVTDFMLPTLTLQPLVENAVKHGIVRKPGGGTVRLATREEPDCYRITVEDDGVGFDPDDRPRDGRSHIGIDNVRGRVEAMCGGVLTVESSPGAGTVATLLIPKRRKEE